MKYVISACLLGKKCRYDGDSKTCEKVMEIANNNEVIAICPEEIVLGTPRIPCENKGANVISKEGKDMTKIFEEGAKKALEMALKNGCKKAILKSKSPSCGYGKVYDGSFSGKLVDGNGVFAQMLLDEGFDVKTEKDF